MALNNVLLVCRNNQGICEENFLSTVDEFIEKYCLNRSAGAIDVDRLNQVILGAEPYKWEATFYARGDDSYDLRLCQGPEDLLQFLQGDYNDSIEDMEDRNPGTAGNYDGWYWENDAECFSALAVQTVQDYIREQSLSDVGKAFKESLLNAMPDFPFAHAQPRKALPLEDVIKQAEQKRDQQGRSGVSTPSLQL